MQVFRASKSIWVFLLLQIWTCYGQAINLVDTEILARFNAYREQYGAPPLFISEELKREATACANFLVKLNIDVMTQDLPSDLTTTCNEGLDALQYFAFGEEGRTGPLEVSRPIIDQWLAEAQALHAPEDLFHYQDSTRHITQILWRRTLEIGCSVSNNLTRTGRRKIMVCFYNPPGNVQYGGSNKPFRDNIGTRISRRGPRPPIPIIRV